MQKQAPSRVVTTISTSFEWEKKRKKILRTESSPESYFWLSYDDDDSSEAAWLSGEK